MAAFNFPASPSNGDTYTLNSVTYQWDGTKWVRYSAAVGAQGSTGPTGAQGAQGSQGHQGLQGAQAHISTSAPSSGVNNGDLWWESDTGDLAIYYNDGNSSQWVDINTGPRGAQGATGPTGAQGATAAQGAQGATGSTGPTGAQGATGATGAQGATAAQGAQGATGSGGATGAQGATGPTGAQGATGSTGSQGAAGSATLTNVSNNRVMTSVSGTTLNAESNLNFNGSQLLIGTTTAAAFSSRKLTVSDVSSGGTTAMEIRSATNGTGRIYFTDSTSSSDAGSYAGKVFYDHTDDHMAFYTGGGTSTPSEKLKIKADGKVLIGGTLGLGGATSSPSGLLHAQTSSGEAEVKILGATNGVIQLSGYAGNSTINFGDSSSDTPGRLQYNHGNDSFHIRTGSNNRLHIMGNGDYGFNDSSPTANASGNDTVLSIKGKGSSYSGKIDFKDSSGNIDNSIASDNSIFMLNCDPNSQNGNTSMMFSVHGSERFRFGRHGQLGIAGANYGTSGQVLTSQGSSSAVTWSTVASSNTSFKNLVTNGSMQVAQRGTSSTSSGLNTIDRWTMNWNGGGVTQSQISEQSGTAFENGFSNYLRITNTGNTTTDTDYRFIGHTMEAQFIANSGWNFKSSSSYVTVSAWVRSSLAGTYYGWLNSRDGTNLTYTFSYTLSANTWTKVTKTIPGNSNMTIHNNNEEGLILHFIPWYGTYYTTSGHTLNAWQTSSSTNRTPDYQQNWANTSNATFDVTGVQLEVGDSASTFEFRSEAEELERCKRYFQKDLNRRAYWGSGNVSDRQFPVRFGVEMRDSPTISFYSTSLDSGGASAYSVTRQGYNFAMTGSGRFYEWAHTATADI